MFYCFNVSTLVKLAVILIGYISIVKFQYKYLFAAVRRQVKGKYGKERYTHTRYDNIDGVEQRLASQCNVERYIQVGLVATRVKLLVPVNVFMNYNINKFVPSEKNMLYFFTSHFYKCCQYILYVTIFGEYFELISLRFKVKRSTIFFIISYVTQNNNAKYLRTFEIYITYFKFL